MTRNIIILLFTLFIIVINSYGQDNYMVTAENGLLLRKQPNAGGEKIGKLPYGSLVQIIEKTKNHQTIQDDEKVIQGTWVKIKVENLSDFISDEKYGYVFDGYLKEEIIDADDYETIFHKTKLHDNTHNSKIEYYTKESNSQIDSFVLAENSFDKFTYLYSGYHEVHKPDFNNDNKSDLVIYYAYENEESYSYYLYNTTTKAYMFLSEYKTSKQVTVKKSRNTNIVTFKSILSEHDDEVEGTENIQYATNEIVFNKDFIKLKETEILEHYFSSVTTVTEIFPKSIQKYPLLDDGLPTITFSQSHKEFPIQETYQTIKLKREAFSIAFPGQLDSKPFTKLSLRSAVKATFDESLLPINIIGKQTEKIDDFHGETTRNSDVEDLQNEFSISEYGHNNLFYNPAHKTLVQKSKKLKNTVLLLKLNIDHFYDYDQQKLVNFEDISKPIYLLFFTDKNRNLTIDKNEFHYITLLFE